MKTTKPTSIKEMRKDADKAVKKGAFEDEVLFVLNSYRQFSNEILPQAGPLCFDIGNLNDGLIALEKLRSKLEK